MRRAKGKGGASAPSKPTTRQRKQRLRILPGHAARIGDRQFREGDELEVSASVAKALIADGYAEPASNPKPEPKRRPPRKQAPRRPLTARAIQNFDEHDNEAERGG